MSASEFHTKAADPNCNPQVEQVLKQVGQNIEQAAIKYLKSVLTVVNITKCMKTTGDDVGDEWDKLTGPDLDNNHSGENRRSQKNRKSKKLLAPNKGKNAAPTQEEPQYIQYPSKFTEGPLQKVDTKTKINWNLQEGSSVYQRWKCYTTN